MKLTVIPLVIGALRTVPRRLVKGLKDLEIRGQVETIQNTALLRSARILRRVLMIKEKVKKSQENSKPSSATETSKE